MQCNDGKDHGYGHQVHLRAVRRHLACSGRRQATGHVPCTDVPVALLEPTDLPSQGKQDIKVRQGRNLQARHMTDSDPCIAWPVTLGEKAGLTGIQQAIPPAKV